MFQGGLAGKSAGRSLYLLQKARRNRNAGRLETSAAKKNRVLKGTGAIQNAAQRLETGYASLCTKQIKYCLGTNQTPVAGYYPW